MELFVWLQNWYKTYCQGNWEHPSGIRIGTLDNPGWSVKINLLDTYLENRNFTEVSEEYRDDDWLFCRIRNGKFEGHGDPDKLYAILTVFKDWAESEKNADNTQNR